MGLREQIGRLLEPLEKRVRAVAVRGVVRLVNDAALLQEVQVSLMEGELVQRAEHFQAYGFTSVPKDPPANGRGAEAIVLRLGGAREHAVVIAVDDRRYRLKGLANGEVALYDDQGSYVRLKRAGKIEVFAGTEVKLDAANTSTIVMDALGITITAPKIDLVKAP